MVWLAVDNVAVVQVAVVTPLVVLTAAAAQMVLVPSVKVTVPLGLATAVLPGLLTLTVAVKVTVWPDTDGLTDEDTVVVVLALLTTWVSEAELPVKFSSPLQE